MTPAQWIQLAATLEPGIVSLVQDILGLTKKYPALTPEQIMATVNTILGSVAAENAETLALINGALTPSAPAV